MRKHSDIQVVAFGFGSFRLDFPHPNEMKLKTQNIWFFSAANI